MKILGKRIKKRHIAFVLLLSYLVVCQSCMTMRPSKSETDEFFDKKHVKYRDKYLHVDGNTLHYIETGNAKNPTLFFVHGSPGSWDAYKQYLGDSLLLKKFRMISVDRPGFGNSDYGTPQDMFTNATLLSEIARKIQNGKPMILVGHSLGGPIVVKMMADNPAFFDKMVVLAGSVDPKYEGAKWRYVVKAPPIRYMVPGAMRFSNDELAGLRRNLLLLEPQLGSISGDVLIIHGTKDPLVPFENVAYLKSKLVNVSSLKIIPIEGANHFIPWEHYGLIRDELLQL